MILNKNTPRKIKQRQDCRTLKEIEEFISQYYDIYHSYKGRQFGKEANWTLIYKDTKRNTDIELTLIWYNDEDLITEVKLEWFKGWRDEQHSHKRYDFDIDLDTKLEDDCWKLWNSEGRRDIVENCNILDEIMNFIIEFEPKLAPALIREKKLKQLLQ